MREHIFFIINGIRYNPGRRGWVDNAVDWIHENSDHEAEGLEYGCLASTRWMKQASRSKLFAGKVAESIGRYHIHLIGHSNGCDVILRILRNLREGWKLSCPGNQIASVRLVAPACEADCERNGLNLALESCQLGEAHVHWATKDRAMTFARISTFLFRHFGKGYGYMGLKGPANLSPFMIHRYRITPHQDFGHSTFWEPEQFPASMQALTKLDF